MSLDHEFANIKPPMIGKVVPVTLEAVSHRYDLEAIDGFWPVALENTGVMFVTFQSDVEFFYAFSPTDTGSLTPSAANAAGAAPLTFTSGGCARAVAGEHVSQPIGRKDQRYLIVRGAGPGILRFWPSSNGTAR